MTKAAGWTAAAAAAPDRALPGGTRIDDYEIEQTLAESGVAIVYRAFDHALGLQVALEEYMPEALALRSADARIVLRTRAQGHAFDEGRQAFVGEAQTLARCDHPALLRVDRVLQRNGTVYRVMRLATGPTLLAHRRAQTRPPDAATLQRWLDDLLGALAALHAEGCVHGAVAPGRILLRDNGHLLLLGFDAVRTKLISGRTQAMMAALEPCFGAPEQRRPAQAAGPWTDLYALAATLRFCIDGELPPPATGLAAAQPAALASAAWQRVRPGAAADTPWLRAVDACLAEAPQDRPQSVAGLRRMIDEAVLVSTLPAWPARRIAPAPSNDSAMRPPEDRAGGTDAPSASAEPARVGAPAPAPAEDAAAAESAPAPGAAVAPMVASAAEPGPASGGESAPADAPPATDAAIAHMLADLDQTLARVAAMAQEEADPKRTPAAPAQAGAAAADAAAEPGPAREPGLGSGAVPAAAVAQGQAKWQADGQGQAQAPARRRRDARAPWPRNAALWLAAAGAAVLAVAAFGLLRVNEERSSARLAASDAAPAAAAIAPPSPAAVAADAQPAKPQPGAAAAMQRADDPAKRPPAPVAAATGAAPAAPQSAAAPSATAAARARPAPRTQCAGKSGYALYQCMQTQCAKRAYAKHPQCVRLLRNRSLN